ncbi:MauE/DoxX family redox-associated membrane protein [Kineococcus sp. SYSU DK002]|uniref:MauE/DoxX family redox-associated membrane protein n=1 Tax=Kineococcus sp. SYSU DK002 TaxID=3383123 RepID=UPI003D7CB7CE
MTAQLLFLVGTVLLLVAGTGKVRHPAGTARALRTQGLPAHPALVRALGLAEVVVAAGSLAGSAAAAWASALAHAGFTGFVLLALVRRRPASSCGCFGEPDLPPTGAHAALTAALALAAGAAAAAGTRGLPAVLALRPGEVVALTAVTGLVLALSLLVLTGLPRLVAARPPTRRSL